MVVAVVPFDCSVRLDRRLQHIQCASCNTAQMRDVDGRRQHLAASAAPVPQVPHVLVEQPIAPALEDAKASGLEALDIVQRRRQLATLAARELLLFLPANFVEGRDRDRIREAVLEASV